MTHSRPIGERELALIELYANCPLELAPQRFYAKWNVTYQQMARICSRSPSTVQRLFSRGYTSRSPNAFDLHHLALMDFLLEHFEQIPAELLHLLCPPP